jgi:hypothetical protein
MDKSATFFHLFLLLRLAFHLLKVKRLGVELVDVEVVLLGQEAVDTDLEKFGSFFPIVLQIPAEVGEQVGTGLHKACHLTRDIVDHPEPISLQPDGLELHLPYLFYDHIVHLQKLPQDAAVFQLQHDPHKLAQLQRFLGSVGPFLEEFLEVGVFGSLDDLGDALFFVAGFAGEEEPAFVLDVFLLALGAFVLFEVLWELRFDGVYELCLVGDEGGAVFAPELLHGM